MPQATAHKKSACAVDQEPKCGKAPEKKAKSKKKERKPTWGHGRVEHFSAWSGGEVASSTVYISGSIDIGGKAEIIKRKRVTKLLEIPPQNRRKVSEDR